MPHQPSAYEQGTFPRVEALIDLIFDWINHRREIAEACNCDERDLGRIARDLGVSSADLTDLVKRGHHAADELPRMMRQLALDPETIARTRALVMHDMERVCSQCSHKRRCRDDLQDRTAAGNYDDYCGNAVTLRSLGAQ